MYIENKYCYCLFDCLLWMLYVEYFINIFWLKYIFINDLLFLVNICIYLIYNILVVGCKNLEVCDLNLMVILMIIDNGVNILLWN